MSERATDFEVNVTFKYSPQKPSSVPVLPGLNIGRSYYGLGEVYGSGDLPAAGKRYERADDESFTIHNGPDSFNQVLMGEGVWYLHVGDKPRLKLSHRPYWPSSYIKPDLVPGLGVGGQLNIAVTTDGRTKRLDEFDSINTRFSPSSTTWRCFDAELSVTIELVVNPLIKENGFVASAEASGRENKEVTLIWEFGQIGEKTDSIILKENYAQLSNPDLKYTLIFVGPVDNDCQLFKGTLNSLAESKEVELNFNTKNPKALFSVKLRTGLGKASRSRFLCVWGYSDYDKKGVEEAYKRLEDKPFADKQWLEEMKKKWFHHWIGRALEPERRFLQIRSHPDEALKESAEFWQIRNRLHVKTPDPEFDTVVNKAAVDLRYQFEYPAFIHGILGWNKYGKINFGYYGADDVGYHDEVENSLKFISGAQDEKGRQCYLSPAFETIRHAEDVDFYFVEQVWYHYRWTGNLEFLKVMWPSVKRTLEHSLAASDPDDDGIMTGFYEFWQSDAHSRGGKCVVQTGMAWAALKSATEIARRVGDEKSAERYEVLLEIVKKQFNKHLWNKEVGAFCSAEWNGDMRPHPEAQEQFLHIMRGLGDSMQKYMAMRYIRDTLFLKPRSGVTLELINDWWPIFWSHHYVANGDTALSVLAACEAGDVDNYWQALRTIAKGAYLSKYATLMNTQDNEGVGTGLKYTAEVQAPFLQAVVEGLFGVKPYLCDNLLVLKPNFPSDWKHAEIATPDFQYSFSKDDGSVMIVVNTPVKRKVRVEIPAKGDIHNVRVDGKEAEYSLEGGVNGARVVIESNLAKTHRFEAYIGEPPVVIGRKRLVLGRKTKFLVKNGVLKKVLDPQLKIEDVSVERRADDAFEASFVPKKLGKATVFLELESGQTSWLHPLDLDVRKQWSIVKRYVAAFKDGSPTVSSPRIDSEDRTLTVEIENNDDVELVGPAIIRVAGKTFRENATFPPLSSTVIKVSLEDVWDRLSPGKTPVSVEVAGSVEVADAVNWDVGKDLSLRCSGRLKRINLDRYYNIDISHLYSSRFKWRLDYTGCGEGVDWRDPMPEKDRLGYVLMHPPVSQLAWGCLPEHAYSLEYVRTESGIKYVKNEFDILWDLPSFTSDFQTPVGVPFKTGTLPIDLSNWFNVLALVNTESYEQLPSAAILEFTEPMQLEKIYLLTANLTKSLKCYYPGAEIIVHYTSGEDQIIQLIPPYTMSCMAQPFALCSYSIPFGRFVDPSKATNALAPEKTPNLAVSDIVLNPNRTVTRIELRCVTSETIFAILGITVLEAKT